MKYEIEIPTPPAQCSPNARVHFMAKARVVRKYRETVGLLTLAATKSARPRHKVAACRAVFRFATERRRDKDNLLASLKPAFDGLVDAGLLSDDAGLTHLPLVVTKGPPRVILVVEAIST